MGERQKRRRFTTEFKAEAVKRLLDGGKGLGEVATELGLSPGQLSAWRNEHLAAGSAEALAARRLTAQSRPRRPRAKRSSGQDFPCPVLLLRPEQVVVVDTPGIDRRRELPGRHPAQPRVAVPELRAGCRLDERPRARGLEHAGVKRPALPHPVQLAGERLALAPGHDARGREPALLAPTPEA